MSKKGWMGQIQWETRQGGKRLTVVAQPFLKARTGTIRWAGIGIEAPADADSLGEILRQHSHADIGDYETLVECVVACEVYIDSWEAGRARELACACTEIAEPPTLARRRRTRGVRAASPSRSQVPR